MLLGRVASSASNPNESFTHRSFQNLIDLQSATYDSDFLQRQLLGVTDSNKVKIFLLTNGTWDTTIHHSKLAATFGLLREAGGYHNTTWKNSRNLQKFLGFFESQTDFSCNQPQIQLQNHQLPFKTNIACLDDKKTTSRPSLPISAVGTESNSMVQFLDATPGQTLHQVGSRGNFLGGGDNQENMITQQCRGRNDKQKIVFLFGDGEGRDWSYFFSDAIVFDRLIMILCF